MTSASPSYHAFADQVRCLAAALSALEPSAAAVGLAPPAGQEWFDLLQRKLLAQLDVPPLLIVAVVGGTNIGKSVIFNNLAGEVASAVSPLAAGTKHPVCLVPPGKDDPALLARLFPSFTLHAWQSPDDPLEDAAENRLFWRSGALVPPRLLLLDAPDVDSDVTVNWERARAIRQAADVLVAVLTQQKYNDAAVKQFFRAAVEADKPILVIFNLCHWEEDRAAWPAWLATFCQQTGRGRSWSTRPLTIARRPRTCDCRSIASPPARGGTRKPTWAGCRPRVSATTWRRCTSMPSRSAVFAAR